QDLARRLSEAVSSLYYRLFDDWNRSFEGLIASLHSGLGTNSPFLQAAKEIADLREELLGLVDDTRFMNFDPFTGEAHAWPANQAEEITRAVQAMALSVLTG